VWLVVILYYYISDKLIISTNEKEKTLIDTFPYETPKPPSPANTNNSRHRGGIKYELFTFFGGFGTLAPFFVLQAAVDYLFFS